MEHTLALIEKAHEGDKAARDTLAEENMGLVWSMVRRFANRGVETVSYTHLTQPTTRSV